ncbi:MAG: DUF2608 domain-containing protein [Parachlamydiaceae bacterium]|nr:DUF2608 domain-containing protein [Parachlamydiaceae bacterium]
MKRIKYLIILSMLPVAFCFGEIIETNSVEQVRQYVLPTALVLFNVNGTLYAPVATLSDKRWRDYFADRVKALISDASGTRLVNRVTSTIVSQVPKEPVEEGASNFIAELQAKRIPVFAVTEKEMSTPFAKNFAGVTSKHLKDLGIDFEKTFIYFKVPVQGKFSQYGFVYGILFANGHPIGQAVSTFVKDNAKFSRVVMIDDSRKSLEAVNAALAGSNIEFIGLRYGHNDQMRDQFDPVLGIIELFALLEENRLMTDDEAQQMKDNQGAEFYHQKLDAYIRKHSI